MRTLATRALLAVILVLTLACMPLTPTCSYTPTPDPTCFSVPSYSRVFDFDTNCTGSALCGWSLETGSARIGGTFIEHEHGLEIDAGGTVSTRIDGDNIRRGGEAVSVIVRCDSGASLTASEAITFGALDAQADTIVHRAVNATASWSRIDAVFLDRSGGRSLTEEFGSVHTLSFAVSGTGRCTIDNVRFTASTQTCPMARDAGALDAFIPRRDVASDTRTDRMVADTGPPQSIFIHCTGSSQCGTGGTCLTTFPGGGICTRRCTNDRACGSDGVCETENMICLPACTSGGRECDRFGGGCVPLDGAFTQGACLPSCYGPASMPPSGFPACAAPMAMCDSYSGVCATMQPVGAADGDPCAADTDCAGNRCIAEIDAMTGEPTGWIGGYCFSFARAGTIMEGQPVPASNCPPGAGVVPLGGEQVGDLAPCFHTCDANSDCRPGYQCDHLTPATGTTAFFSNGICLPVDCNASGMTCPAGYHCVSLPSDAAVPPGQCEAGAAGDAGATDVIESDANDVIDDDAT